MHGTGPLKTYVKRHSLPSWKGRASRRKGLDAERVLVRYLQAKGLRAEKTSRTGYAGTDIAPLWLGAEIARVAEGHEPIS